MNRSVDCVVIGAGVMGAITAYRLAQRGARVALIDADGGGTGTTASSYAQINASYPGYWDYFDLRAAGVAGYRRLRAELGHAPWLGDVGCLQFETDAATNQSLLDHSRRLDDARYSVAVLPPSQLAEMEPDVVVPESVNEIFFYPDEGYLDGPGFVEDLLARSQRHGVELHTHDPVIGFELTGQRVREVILKSQQRIATGSVLCCCGRWTDDVLAMAGTEARIMVPEGAGSTAPGLIVLTSPVPHRLARLVIANGVNIRPAGLGRLMVWDGDLDAELHQVDVRTPEAQQRARELAQVALQSACEYLPVLSQAQVEKATICVRALPADGLPAVGWVPGTDGLYVMAAHAAVSLAPALAEIAGAEVLDLTTDPRLVNFRPDRFVAQREAA